MRSADVRLECVVAGHVRDTPVNIGASLDAWDRWLDGHWSLVEQWDSEDERQTASLPSAALESRRFVVARRTRSEQYGERKLTRQERQCAEGLGLGESSKGIAYGLGVSEAAVTAHLTGARRKLGLRSRTELAAFCSPGGVRRRLVEFAATQEPLLVGAYPLCQVQARIPLTAAERTVVSLLLRGATNQLIAERRCTSCHTTANQVQAIFRKFGVRSRIELATALQGPGLPLGP